MLRKTDIQLLSDFFQSKKEILFAYIFGSLAKGKTNSLSDIDIAVYIFKDLIRRKNSVYGYRASLLTDLLSLLRRNDIDLVILNDANLFLAYQVVNYGKCIYSKDEKNRILFHCRTIDRYLDFKPMLNPHFDMLKKRIKSHG